MGKVSKGDLIDFILQGVLVRDLSKSINPRVGKSTRCAPGTWLGSVGGGRGARHCGPTPSPLAGEARQKAGDNELHRIQSHLDNKIEVTTQAQILRTHCYDDGDFSGAGHT